MSTYTRSFFGGGFLKIETIVMDNTIDAAMMPSATISLERFFWRLIGRNPLELVIRRILNQFEPKKSHLFSHSAAFS